MEILSAVGILAIFAVIIVLVVNHDSKTTEQDRLLENRLLHYRLKSHAFRKEFDPIWRGRVVHNRSELKALLKKFETDPKLKKELDNAIELSRKFDIRAKQRNKERNYFAFNHLLLIREIKKFGKSFTEDQLREIIPLVCRQLDTESEITDIISKLRGYYIIQEYYKDKTKLELFDWAMEITHPYELDEDGNPKIIDL